MADIIYRDHPHGVVRPYSASATSHGIVWACGQIPTDAEGNTPGPIGDQVRVAMSNLEQVLQDAGSSLEHIVKITIFLADLDEFDDFNGAYTASFEGKTLPPRTTVEVSRFRGDKRIEIDAVAALA